MAIIYTHPVVVTPQDVGGSFGGDTGLDGTGAGTSGGGTAVELTPAVVVGPNLRRDDLEFKPEELAPAPTIEALSKDRRKRAAYSDPAKKVRPVKSGLNL